MEPVTDTGGHVIHPAVIKQKKREKENAQTHNESVPSRPDATDSLSSPSLPPGGRRLGKDFIFRAIAVRYPAGYLGNRFGYVSRVGHGAKSK